MNEIRAVEILQARVRGRRWRQRWQVALHGITRLQALQRGRYSRREFMSLLALHRQQRALDADTERRQHRIWTNERELQFLRHTSANDLAKIRTFRQRRAARTIQREWLRSRSGCVRVNEEVQDPRARVFTFSPFNVNGVAAVDTNESSYPDELFGPLPSMEGIKLVGHDAEAMTERRRKIRDRIKIKIQQQNEEEIREATTNAIQPTPPSTRKELCESLHRLRAHTCSRIAHHASTIRATVQEKRLKQAQLVASCSNRLTHLISEQPPLVDPGKDPSKDMESWSDRRKHDAWKAHQDVIHNIISKSHWYETHLAGEMRDIRSTYAANPWESSKEVWTWPRKSEPTSSLQVSTDVNTDGEINKFLFGEAGKQPVEDCAASAWWTAHCTQSHLSFLSDENRPLNVRDGDSREWTPEALANPQLWRVMEAAKCRQRSADHARELHLKAAHMDELVARRVAQVENQIRSNTEVKQELVERERQRELRRVKQQQAAVTIQRHARGHIGRKRAKELHAEVFVMIRGRAVRRGRCEECGCQRAVLECAECVDSRRFCPQCWVHVHATNKRRAHVAMPIVDPLPVSQPKITIKEQDQPQNSSTKNQAEASRIIIPFLQLEKKKEYKKEELEARDRIAARETALTDVALRAAHALETGVAAVDASTQILDAAVDASTQMLEKVDLSGDISMLPEAVKQRFDENQAPSEATEASERADGSAPRLSEKQEIDATDTISANEVSKTEINRQKPTPVNVMEQTAVATTTSDDDTISMNMEKAGTFKPNAQPSVQLMVGNCTTSRDDSILLESKANEAPVASTECVDSITIVGLASCVPKVEIEAPTMVIATPGTSAMNCVEGGVPPLSDPDSIASTDNASIAHDSANEKPKKRTTGKPPSRPSLKDRMKQLATNESGTPASISAVGSREEVDSPTSIGDVLQQQPAMLDAEIAAIKSNDDQANI